MMSDVVAIITDEQYLAGQRLVWLGGTVVGVAAAVWRMLRRAVRQLDAMIEAHVADAMEPVLARQLAIQDMARELIPNGGGSLADVVRRMDERLARMEAATKGDMA